MTRLRSLLAISWRLCGLAALLLMAAAAVFGFAAAIGAMVPRNGDWTEPDVGIPIFLRSNGIHVDLVLPARSAGVDWYQVLPPHHVADPSRAQGWLAFGWGQREFYLRTPAWRDLRPRTALRAVMGGDALMHVTHVSAPVPGSSVRMVTLEPPAYRLLARAVARDFGRGSDGLPVLVPHAGYGPGDAFYDARGRYSAVRTSNQWTADMLAAAGVRIGRWTPLPNGILWRFPQ